MARVSGPCSPSVGIESIPRRKNAGRTTTRGGTKHGQPDALRIPRRQAAAAAAAGWRREEQEEAS
ncbi:hypothetical protein X777_08186 [Ooceraea biroi]|uniref:Uncharacterized protein n=1 Tax=Ooceraea biroi TaxID=2015173 RepID=A0A026X0Q2_OOCBI|nr:hypothetical protein X777_08186 [Ooceraea biroi]